MPAPDAAELAREWVTLAVADLRAARPAAVSSDMEPRHACFLAQQAAEKAIKAAYVLDQVDFPYVHDLNQLRGGLPFGWQVPGDEAKLEWLTRWATEARYPGHRAATRPDSERAIELADQICAAVGQGFDQRGAQ